MKRDTSYCKGLLCNLNYWDVAITWPHFRQNLPDPMRCWDAPNIEALLLLNSFRVLTSFSVASLCSSTESDRIRATGADSDVASLSDCISEIWILIYVLSLTLYFFYCCEELGRNEGESCDILDNGFIYYTSSNYLLCIVTQWVF
jgi:hypothetical protein